MRYVKMRITRLTEKEFLVKTRPEAGLPEDAIVMDEDTVNCFLMARYLEPSFIHKIRRLSIGETEVVYEESK